MRDLTRRNYPLLFLVVYLRTLSDKLCTCLWVWVVILLLFLLLDVGALEIESKFPIFGITPSIRQSLDVNKRAKVLAAVGKYKSAVGIKLLEWSIHSKDTHRVAFRDGEIQVRVEVRRDELHLYIVVLAV